MTDGPAAARLFEVTDAGTFEHGTSTLQLHDRSATTRRSGRTGARGCSPRAQRPQPARDDKVVTAWNGLAIAALAEAGVQLAGPEYLVAARVCARAAARAAPRRRPAAPNLARRTGGRRGRRRRGLRLTWPKGCWRCIRPPARPAWLAAAGDLLDVALTHFRDDTGSFFDTADDAERLVRRPRDPTDNATPSGASSIAVALVSHAALTGSAAHRAAAAAALGAVAPLAETQPRFLGWALAGAEALISGPLQVAIVGERGSGPLTETAWRLRPPGAVIVSGSPDAPGQPLLAGRPLVADGPAAYVCRGMVCDLPVTTAGGLAAALEAGSAGTDLR